MANLLTVMIADSKITASADDVLVTYALGSCVGICLYDAAARVAGLGHIILPQAPSDAKGFEMRNKYADLCVPSMIKEMERFGALKRRFAAKIAGGASMFKVTGDSSFGNVGERNVQAVRQALQKEGIPLVADDTGANYGRTVFFYAADGRMDVKSFVNGIKSY